MKNTATSRFAARYFNWFVPPTTALQSVLLLVVRLLWGWQLFLTGKGKLMDLSRPTQYFESLGIPFPHAQAILAGTTESVGGLLLLTGFCSRLVSVPLMILLTVAFFTADFDQLKMTFSDPDKFLAADEFLFLFVVVLVFVFGPGKLSLDALIAKYFKRTAGKASWCWSAKTRPNDSVHSGVKLAALTFDQDVEKLSCCAG